MDVHIQSTDWSDSFSLPIGQITGDQVVYENELVATQDVRAWDSGSITRDSIFR